MSANITVVPAMPNASVNAAVPVNVFARQRPRYARRRSWLSASSIVVTQVASTATGGPTLVVSQSNPHFRRCTSTCEGCFLAAGSGGDADASSGATRPAACETGVRLNLRLHDYT